MFEIIHIEMFISLCFSSLFFQAMFDYSKPVVNYESGHQLDNSRSRNQCQTTRPRQSAHSSLMGRTSMHFWKEDVSFQAESLEIVATLSNNCPTCPVGASLRFFRVDWHSFRWEPIFGNTGCSPMMIGADLSPKISASVYLQHHSLILPSCVCVAVTYPYHTSPWVWVAVSIGIFLIEFPFFWFMKTHVLWLFIVHPHVLWFPHRRSHCDRSLPGGQGVQPTRRSAKSMLRGGPLSFCEGTLID
jgi:hypothetical protein